MTENSHQDSTALKGKTGVMRIVRATGYSLAGLHSAFKGEAAFRQLLLLNVILLPLAFFFDVTSGERALMVFSSLAVLVIELFNSAIEAVVDRVSLELHPLSKNAKDMGSAAQMIGLVMVAAVWGIILLGL